jgi:hypothetical protein
MGVGLVADVGPEATTRFFEFFMVPVRNKNTRIVYYHAIGEFLAWSQRCGFLVWKTSKCIPCRAQTTGFAAIRRRFLFLGRRCCETLVPFSFKWQPNIATTQKSTSSPRRWREHFPISPSPALQFPIALPIFSRSSAVSSRFIELTD